MESQDNISLYANILQSDSNFEAQFLEKSQNTPMSIQDSSLKLKIVTPMTATWGGNFSVEKDVLLVSAWLNISVDPVHGNEQKQETFTVKVWQYFCMHNAYGTKHSSSSLKSQWSMINRETSNFCGVMAKIEAKNQSGATNKDKKAETANRKRKDGDKDFGEYLTKKLHYIEEAHIQEKEALQIKVERVRVDEQRIVFEKERVRVDEERINFEKERLQIQMLKEDERIGIEKERLHIEMEKEDQKIMMMDTSGMMEIQRTFFEKCQEESIARLTSGGITKDICHASLDEVLELWRSCTKFKTMSQAFFPTPPSNLKHHTTQSYERWWNSTHGTYLEDGIVSLISSTHSPLPRMKTGQINHDKNDNGGGIPLSDDRVTRVVQKSVTDKAQFVKPQDVIVRPKMPPFKAFLVDGPPGVCMASNEKMDPYLEKVSESSDKECHWRRAKKKLKLLTPSELDFIEGTSYAFEHVEVAADQPIIKYELLACGETLRNGLASVEARIVELQEKLEHLSNCKKDLKASILNNDEKLSN
nr:hypothetical protein CFP56_02275 [Quercus suber]